MVDFKVSSKSNPCPVCARTKDGDCRTREDGNLVLCHTHSMGNGEVINGYRFCGRTDDELWGQWGWVESKGLKSDRPTSITYYEYPDRAGNLLIRVARKDNARKDKDKENEKSFWQEYFINGIWYSGGKVSGSVKAEMKAHLPIYRYCEVQKAIASGEPIVFCEGEKTADALWSIGIAATTSIGGGNALDRWGDYSEDLNGANLIASPDWDKKGFRYSEKVCAKFGIKQWLLPFSDSPRWSLTLVKDGGLDLADQIKGGATKEKLMAAIAPTEFGRFKYADDKEEDENADKTLFVDTPNKPVDMSVYKQKPLAAPNVDVVDVVDGGNNIDEILESLKESREIELAGGDQIDCYAIFPANLADAVIRVSKVLPCPVEALVTAILSVSASIIGTSSKISPKNTWSEPVVFWGMIVGGTGAMKSAALSAVTDPLIRLQAQEERRFESAHEAWEQAKKEAEKEKEDFSDSEPDKKEYYLDDATFEAVGNAHKENLRGFLMLLEEMDAFFTGMNKYRSGGKGDDLQRWLAINSGKPIKVDKLSRKLFVEKTAVSFIGTIQTETVLPTLRKTENNISGLNGRWNYCAVEFPCPLTAVENDEQAIVDLQILLTQLYKRLAQLEGGDRNEDGVLNQIQYLFTQESYDFWMNEWMPYIVPPSRNHVHSGYKSVLAKQRGFAARNAAIIHLIQGALSNKKPSRFVPLDMVRGGVAIAQFFCNQAKALYGIAGVESSEDTEWTPILLKLKEASLAATATDGWIKPRDAKLKTRLIKSSEQAKSIFAQLHESNIGELDTSGKTPSWRWVDIKEEPPVYNVNNVNKSCSDWVEPVYKDVNKTSTGCLQNGENTLSDGSEWDEPVQQSTDRPIKKEEAEQQSPTKKTKWSTWEPSC